MTLNEVKKILKASDFEVERYDEEDEPTYSGRSMYGEKTFAVVVQHVTDVGRCEAIIKRKLRWDNLGRNYIAY